MLFQLLREFSGLLFFVLHVSGAGSFPKSLSAKEEQEQLRRMAAGDRTARTKLIEHNLRLVAHIVKKYYGTAADQEDLISIGTVGLIKAVDTFDMNKGIRLSSYAARCVENEILMFFRSAKKTAQDVSINEPIDVDKDGNALTLMDILAQEDTTVEDLDLKFKTEKLYRFIVSSLEDREKEIIVLRYGLAGSAPLPQREVAKKLHISRSYV
ncbi:MAG: RNA polymerase sporulation sigma factor SigK [Clostridia bacterium]|nr:RNA polymerase sporulation sigma factor SigK [Clostridia bacterium]